jgi:hypothetical protein
MVKPQPRRTGAGTETAGQPGAAEAQGMEPVRRGPLDHNRSLLEQERPQHRPVATRLVGTVAAD